jgi:hypothetical protein
MDTLLISETHFTTKYYFGIPRYKLYYTNNPDGTVQGGTACDTWKRNDETLWIVKIRIRLHSSYVNKSERISIWDNRHSRLLSTPTQSKKGTFCDILSNTRTKIFSRRQLQQQTQSMGLIFNNTRQRNIKGNPREKLVISINWNTNILAYWCKQNPGSTRFLCNQWNLLNIQRHNQVTT